MSCSSIFICTWERADSSPYSKNYIVGLQSTGIKYEPLMCRRILSLVPSTLLIPLRSCDKSPSHWQNRQRTLCYSMMTQRLTAANAAESGCSFQPTPSHLQGCEGRRAAHQSSRKGHAHCTDSLCLSPSSVPKSDGQHLASDSKSLFLVTFYPIYSIPVTTEYSCKCMYGGCCNLLVCINFTTVDYARQKLSW